MSARPPAVAGRFFPAGPDELRHDVDLYLETASPPPRDDAPHAVIAPHAGYAYSGPVAGSAFAMLRRLPSEVRRAIVIGPSHYVAFDGVATSGFDRFRTPLGDVSVDAAGLATAAGFDFVRQFEAAHEREHSLETHLPFLQRTLPDFRIVPLVTGRISPHQLGELLDALWDPNTVLCVSTDLSHFEDHDNAARHDAQTAARIEALDLDLAPTDACGAVAVAGLLQVARHRGMDCRAVDLRNSGDTAGGKDRVVGYGAFGLWRSA